MRFLIVFNAFGLDEGRQIVGTRRRTRTIYCLPTMTSTRNEIQELARANKYRLHPFALRRLSEFLDEYDTGDEYRRDLLRDLFALLQKQCGRDRFVDETKVDAAINIQVTKIKGIFEKDNGSAVQVVPLSEIPHTSVDEVSGELKVSSAAVATNRLGALRERYLLARRRCLRSGLYQKDMASGSLSNDALPLLPSSALEGLDPRKSVAVLGLIVVREGKIYLEDLKGSVELRLDSHSQVTENSFVGCGFMVVATGSFANSVFHVGRIDLPPAEHRDLTLRDIGPNVDVFGLAPPDTAAALQEEKSSVRSVIIVMAHVQLDRASTMSKLAFFFQKMQDQNEAELRHVTFVLSGDFSSSALHFGDASHLPEIFDESQRFQGLLDGLAKCISTNAPTAAQQSQFVLIPGPNDMTLLQGFQPQTPIAPHFAKGLEPRIKRLQLAPNPCRLRFHTHEVIVARRDFLREFQRDESCFPWEAYRQKHGISTSVPSTLTTSFERITKTVLDEAHLSPSISGTVLWKMDDALRVPVLPHALLLCDSTEQWECYYKGVRVVNPGSFALSGTFLWYTPADGGCSLSNLE